MIWVQRAYLQQLLYLGFPVCIGKHERLCVDSLDPGSDICRVFKTGGGMERGDAEEAALSAYRVNKDVLDK